MKKMVEHVDFEFIFPEEGAKDTTHIKLLQGPFKNVIYWYGSITVEEDENKTAASLVFDYEILKKPDDLKDSKLEENIDFKNIIGDIIMSMLMEKFGEENPLITEENIVEVDLNKI